jgi:3-deoxy-D-manno-octulosonic-acid transferase
MLWKPNYIFLVDSEIWPNLLLKSKSLGIPLAIINARITSKSFKRWMMFPKTAVKIFSCFDLCLASNYETEKFFKTLQVKNDY